MNKISEKFTNHTPFKSKEEAFTFLNDNEIVVTDNSETYQVTRVENLPYLKALGYYEVNRDS